MITIEGFNGELYSAPNASRVVAQMRTDAWGGEHTDGVRGYMRQIQKRVHDWSGDRIRIHTPLAFLEDLAACNMIRIKKGKSS